MRCGRYDVPGLLDGKHSAIGPAQRRSVYECVAAARRPSRAPEVGIWEVDPPMPIRADYRETPFTPDRAGSPRPAWSRNGSRLHGTDVSERRIRRVSERATICPNRCWRNRGIGAPCSSNQRGPRTALWIEGDYYGTWVCQWISYGLKCLMFASGGSMKWCGFRCAPHRETQRARWGSLDTARNSSAWVRSGFRWTKGMPQPGWVGEIFGSSTPIDRASRMVATRLRMFSLTSPTTMSSVGCRSCCLRMAIATKYRNGTSIKTW